MADLYEHLPLVEAAKTTAYDEWPKMDRIQKLGASAAMIVTVSGPILRFLVEAKQGKNEQPTPEQFFAGLAVDLRDKLDGTIAKSTEGVTSLGAEADPLADKIDFFIQEYHHYRRGTLPLGHLALRLARDIVVTVLRSHVKAVTNGQANVAAGWHGKASTITRLVSDRATGLPLNNALRTVHQTAATTAILASGAKNVADLLNAKKAYLERTGD